MHLNICSSCKKQMTYLGQKMAGYTEDLTWVLMFYWIYETSCNKHVAIQWPNSWIIFLSNFNHFSLVISWRHLWEWYNTMLYIEDLTWVIMFYWIYKTSWGKEIKCEACRAFYLFRNEFNIFNNTGAQMLASIYHMTLKLFWNHVRVLQYACSLKRHFITFPENL